MNFMNADKEEVSDRPKKTYPYNKSQIRVDALFLNFTW